MATITFAKGGSWVKFQPDKTVPPSPEKKYSSRGEVSGFSRKSRNRLLSLLNQIPRKALQGALFVTLTYPKEYPSDKEAKEHLDTLGKRLKRIWPTVALVWRIEKQKRGAPHFHLVILGVSFLPKEWLAGAWYAIVGSGDEKHLYAGTQVQRVRRFGQLIAYASKYLAKVDKETDYPDGRQWGVIGRQHLPIELVEVQLSESDMLAIKRIARSRIAKSNKRIIRILGNRFVASTVFIPSVVIVRLLMGPGNLTLKRWIKQYDPSR